MNYHEAKILNVSANPTLLILPYPWMQDPGSRAKAGVKLYTDTKASTFTLYFQGYALSMPQETRAVFPNTRASMHTLDSILYSPLGDAMFFPDQRLTTDNLKSAVEAYCADRKIAYRVLKFIGDVEKRYPIERGLPLSERISVLRQLESVQLLFPKKKFPFSEKSFNYALLHNGRGYARLHSGKPVLLGPDLKIVK